MDKKGGKKKTKEEELKERIKNENHLKNVTYAQFSKMGYGSLIFI